MHLLNTIKKASETHKNSRHLRRKVAQKEIVTAKHENRLKSLSK